MDDVMRALRDFDREFNDFTQVMNDASRGLEREHNRVRGLWHDSFSRTYHGRWNTFDQHMTRYLRNDAPKYRQFLQMKIRQLGQYLGHG
ncbi:MAG: hypothetical protein QOJ63_1880 [Solirubrobacteraceae bacterium]|jgi:uncharacterized protein YukE|nr:hypothetical protein [Solirubrobacteraceae bacterium]